MNHHTSITLLPHLRLWVPWCSICGQVGLGSDSEAEAWAAADRHREAQGLTGAEMDQIGW